MTRRSLAAALGYLGVATWGAALLAKLRANETQHAPLAFVEEAIRGRPLCARPDTVEKLN
jgi:hypothetical protein